MHIGIVVYSQTGNTRLAGERLKELLEDQGHQATLHQIAGDSDADTGENGSLPSGAPAVQNYEGLVFGSPVHAFSVAPAMQKYLSQLPQMEDRPVACFVTKQLPFYRAGGTQALARMEKLCRARGARVLGNTVVFWNRSPRDEHIRQCMEELVALF